MFEKYGSRQDFNPGGMAAIQEETEQQRLADHKEINEASGVIGKLSVPPMSAAMKERNQNNIMIQQHNSRHDVIGNADGGEKQDNFPEDPAIMLKEDRNMRRSQAM